MYYAPGITFFLFAGLAIVIFFLGLYDHISIWRNARARGVREKIRWDRALGSFLTGALLQVPILRLGLFRWAIHISISMGFLGLFLHTSFLFLLDHFIPRGSGFHRFIVEGRGKYILDVWGDSFGSLLLLGLLMAIVRRYVLRPAQLETLLDDTVTIFSLVIVTITGFLAEAFRLALLQPVPENWYSFLGNLMASLLRGSVTEGAHHIVLYTHIFFSLSFIAYIPYSKIVHILFAPMTSALSASDAAHLRVPAGGESHA